MLANLQMNDHRITGLTNSPSGDDEAANKKYVNENISKSNIKPSHTPKNVFQYLMDDVNEWTERLQNTPQPQTTSFQCVGTLC